MKDLGGFVLPDFFAATYGIRTSQYSKLKYFRSAVSFIMQEYQYWKYNWKTTSALEWGFNALSARIYKAKGKAKT